MQPKLPNHYALQVDLQSDGPAVWAQLLDAEGRKVATLQDPEVDGFAARFEQCLAADVNRPRVSTASRSQTPSQQPGGGKRLEYRLGNG